MRTWPWVHAETKALTFLAMLVFVAACGSGGGPASWVVAEPALVDDGTHTFDIAVRSAECASGAREEIAQVEVQETSRQVVITATMEPLDVDANVTCPENEPTTVRVELAEPLGDRDLVDGGCERFAELADLSVCVNPVRWSPR